MFIHKLCTVTVEDMHATNKKERTKFPFLVQFPCKEYISFLVNRYQATDHDHNRYL